MPATTRHQVEADIRAATETTETRDRTDTETSQARSQPSQREGMWTSRRALVAHAAIAVWVPGCVVACWWQVEVALSGDSLGWVYSVMWPCFAVFGVVFWWHLVHDDPETLGSRGLRGLQQTPNDVSDVERRMLLEETITLAEEEDPELAAYNAYLADLARGDRPRTRRRH